MKKNLIFIFLLKPNFLNVTDWSFPIQRNHNTHYKKQKTYFLALGVLMLGNNSLCLFAKLKFKKVSNFMKLSCTIAWSFRFPEQQRKNEGSAKYGCKFNSSWTKTYPSLQPAEDDIYSFYCIVCAKKVQTPSYGGCKVSHWWLGTQKLHQELAKSVKDSRWQLASTH